MNILVPDKWLREFLKTKATPKELKDCLSLCGPSVERVNKVDGEVVYDIEVTGNRPDMMSVSGIAREASVILPRFGIPATFINDPYAITAPARKGKPSCSLSLTVDPILCPRFTAVVMDHIEHTSSPLWMQEFLTLSGMRPINAVVDITNYLMKAFGQPVHAFDYDRILPDKTGVPTMILRPSKKGETVITLDGKTHTLPGDDIVIEDGEGRLVDLCGIMGGGLSSMTDQTKRMILFVQNYDPVHVRRTSMALAHRTDAAGLFEKGVDAQLVMPTIAKGIELITAYAGGHVASELYDLYPKPFAPYGVSVTKNKVSTYIGAELSDKDIEKTLTPLGFSPVLEKDTIRITVPSYRRDITIDVDVIEEIARIYGYHTIKTKLPDTEPPMVFEDPMLNEEWEIKTSLKNWGYTEILTYSMLSEKDMDLFGFPKEHAYAITNPLSSEWVYMRPSLVPGLLMTIKQNLSFRDTLSLFELSMIYDYRNNDLPKERPMLIVGKTGNAFYNLKGLAEAIFSLYGIPFPKDEGSIPEWFSLDQSLMLGEYGVVGMIAAEYLNTTGISTPVTVLSLDMQKLHEHRSKEKQYTPPPKYPASYEDIAVTIPEKTLVGPMITDMKKADPLVAGVTLLDSYQDTRTFHITYQSKTGNLTAEDTKPVREKILKLLARKYQASLKGV